MPPRKKPSPPPPPPPKAGKTINDILIEAIGLQNLGHNDEAAILFRQVLAIDPKNAAAYYSLSVILLHQNQLDAALAISTQGAAAAPNFAPMHFVHGAALQAVGRKEEAVQAYDRSLAIAPNELSVLLNSGVLLRDMMRHREALERFNHALTVDPNHQASLGNCGIILTEFKQSEQAIAMFDRLLKLNPDYDWGWGLLCYEQMHICEWKNVADLSVRILEGIRAGKRTSKSLAVMAFSDSAHDHYLAARIFADYFTPRNVAPVWQGERYRHKKIRLAYVSPDLREHPVGHLMCGVIERHDKSRFHTVGISLGIDDGSRIRARMLAAFDEFIDVRHMTSRQIAQLMREKEIDVAVDLAGYTSDSRSDIFAHRPAPVQVNFLGYSGTLGANYMDYIIADRHVIPPEHWPYYSEKVAYLPDAYLPTDNSVKISERTPTRAECGLPETGVVFCSFSHDYKISPRIFDIWMRLLHKVPGSVLWLVSRNDLSKRNLCNEAERRGIDPSRLVFAGRVPLVEDHLARYRQADLFLDTHPYGAHTTTSDALMAGLPVITVMGNAFPARVAASLLYAIGLADLIAGSLDEYEALALRLATDPLALAQIKARLRANQATHPLFDTEAFSRNLEALYISMWRTAELGGVRDALSPTAVSTAGFTQPGQPA